MSDKDKLSWITRFKLCYQVLLYGLFDPTQYRTRYAQKQWEICQKRQREMDACVRPRTKVRISPDDIEQ